MWYQRDIEVLLDFCGKYLADAGVPKVEYTYAQRDVKFLGKNVKSHHVLHTT